MISAGVPLKRDINLISNREAQEKLARRGLFAIAALVFLAGFAYFAFYMPLMAGKLMESTLLGVNQQLAAYSKTDEDFNKLTARVQNLQTLVDSVAASKSTDKSGYDYLKMIESACPASLFLTQIMFNSNDITLTGVADADSDVAQLVVNMQSYPDFSHVTVTSVTTKEAVEGTVAAEPAQTPGAREFVIVASFPQPAAAAAEAPAATPESNGGSGT